MAIKNATREQIQEQANAIALQAAAIADGKIDDDTLFAQVQLIASNVKTLQYWTDHLKPQPVSQHKAKPHPFPAEEVHKQVLKEHADYVAGQEQK